MKNYVDFISADFAMDEDFQSWVFNPSESNKAFWENWIAEHPEKLKEVEEAYRILSSVTFSGHTLPDHEVSAIWNRIRQPAKKTNHSNHSNHKKNVWFSVAAVVVFVIVSFVVVLNQNTVIKYETAYGESRTIVLPDSSTVSLNSNSSVRFASSWNNTDARQIWLEGEAYFSVVHKQNNQPFRVMTTNDLTVEVLGTTFTVYHRTDATKVVLNSGSVRLNMPAENQTMQSIMMKPGELVEYKKHKYIRRKIDPEIYSAWTTNKLILDHTSLQEMIIMLKENYGVTVEVENPLWLGETVSGSMPLANADHLVMQIAKAFRLRAEKEGDKYILKEVKE